MATSNHLFKQLQNLPLKCGYHLPKPSFYPKDSNSIIISTDYAQNNADAGVFKYNIDNNNLEKLLEYGVIDPFDHGQFIDYNNDTLHILYGDNSHITMDLKTNTINNVKDKLNIDCGAYPKCVEISSIKGDEIHIVSDLKHDFKFDCN
eukprot:365277_1